MAPVVYLLLTTLVWPILLASLLGSPHCAAMCGAFAYLAAPGPRPPRGAARHAGHGTAPATPAAHGTHHHP